MKDFLEKRAPSALDGLLSCETGPKQDAGCASCGGTFEGAVAYRCYDCIMPPTLCKNCLLKSHSHTPFHFVRVWDPRRQFWERRPLTELGVILELGHEGHRCWQANTARPMTIISEEGVHTVQVRFCACRDPETNLLTPDSTQLLAHSFWPASWDQPMTACTVQVLKTFTRLASLAHVNAKDFFECLRHKTDSIAPQHVEVFYSTRLKLHVLTRSIGPLSRIPDRSPNICFHGRGEATPRRFLEFKPRVAHRQMPGVPANRCEHGSGLENPEGA